MLWRERSIPQSISFSFTRCEMYAFVKCVQAKQVQDLTSGVKSDLYFALVILRLPLGENAMPCLPNLVGSTQSNISNPFSIACRISSGVPTPMRYLGFFSGSSEPACFTISWMSFFSSPTLTHHTAMPSRAYCERNLIDCDLRSLWLHHWTIGKSTPRDLSYFFLK